MTESGRADVTSRVPLHTFTGRSDHLVGMIILADSTIDFFLDLTTLKTGIGKRDKDLRITLNTDEFPFAEFYGKLVSPFRIDQAGPQRASVEGEFSIHGVTRPLRVEGSLELLDGAMHLLAEWELNVKDFDIVPPRLLIIKVHEVQVIRIEATLERTNE